MRTILIFFALLCCVSSYAQTHIHLDQFGYLPNASKVAVLSDPQLGFNSNESYSPSSVLEVRDDATDAVVLSLSPEIFQNGLTQASSGDKGWWLDFSALNQPGEYYIYDAGNQMSSPVFTIGEDVYQDILVTAGRMFYYNRCGIAKPEQFAGTWSDGMSFAQDTEARDVYDQGNAETAKDMSGGWYDAGDNNKYVTFAHSVVHDLLWAYRENPQAFNDSWNLPESGNGVPDIIDELKWELDWLMRMNNEDGSTYLKIGNRNYGENVQSPPSLNTDTRYYAPTCTSASIDIASMFAHAAKVFAEFDIYTDYAAELETRAVSSWNYFITALENNALETACDDGSVVSGDADREIAEQKDDALIAAVHLFDLTGENTYHNYFLNNFQETEQVESAFWGAYRMALNEAFLYYTTLPDADAGAKSQIINSITTDSGNNYNGYYGFNADDLYRSYMPDWSFHWGSNQVRAHYGNLNLMLNKYNINPESTGDRALYAEEALHYFHGTNPLGMVYLSNMYEFGAEKSVNEIYHFWFDNGTEYDNAQSSAVGPAPGYVTGGPNQYFSVASIAPPADQPLQKSYLDWNTGFPDASWEITEPAIYYQAAYVRFLANFVTAQMTVNTNDFTVNKQIEIAPNPTENTALLSGLPAPCRGEVYSIEGKLMDTFTSENSDFLLNLGTLPQGMYMIKTVNENGKIQRSGKILKK